uniref:Right handed beta helix domain-containing protein n=1 Tax=Anopheles melas TaxID=34690 RepID=A0A182U0A2_9DIPT
MESGHSIRRMLLLMLAITFVTLHHRAVVVTAAAAVSVCSGLCTCTNQNFVTVDCALGASNRTEDTAAEPIVLDGQLQLPASATALHIKLLAGGQQQQLIIRKEFFQPSNNINHLSIDGSESRTGSSDTVVEFQEGALCNNHGQFPEILIANVGRVVMHRNISCRPHLLNITHVNDVLLKTEFLSVSEAELFIQDVNNLHIEPNAFSGSTSSRVEILRTTIESLPKLGVSFRLLSFSECNISEITSHALDANEIEHVEFVACRLTSLRTRAVTERLLTDSLIFRGCYIHSIERQFVNGSGLNNLVLDSNTIDDIAAGAFTFTSVNTLVTGNHIIRTGKEWLHPRDWVNVTIAGNSFGEFNGILLKDRKRTDRTDGVDCYFGNNTITNALPDSFTFGRISCRVGAVHFGRECDCEYGGWLSRLFGLAGHASLPSAVTSSVSCQVEESLRYCFNRSDGSPLHNDTTSPSSTGGQVNVHYFLTEFCEKNGSKKCSSYAASGEEAANRKPPPLIPLDKIDSLGDGGNASFLQEHLFPISIAAGALLIAVAVILVICIGRRRASSETQHQHHQHQTMTAQTAGSRQGTFRSASLNRCPFTPADRRIISNALSWIREAYGPDVWSKINTPMQELLAQNGASVVTEEKDKVRLIGTILDSLKHHEIGGTQIVALNDVLFRQLGPPAVAAAAVAPELAERARPNSDNHDELLGHIYDELQPNRGAPRLLGDYAAPLDHGAVTVVPEGIYSEPVLHGQRLPQAHRGDNRNLISPYAIGDATVQRNPAGAEGNLPDVIRPTGHAWKANAEEDDLDDEDEDDIDGEAERKTMLRPPMTDGGSAGAAPTYAISLKQLKRPHRGNTPPPTPPPPVPSGSGGEDQPDDGNRSEHSGSSMQTVRIEDMTLADNDAREQR